jgi:hypothetical protein
MCSLLLLASSLTFMSKARIRLLGSWQETGFEEIRSSLVDSGRREAGCAVTLPDWPQTGFEEFDSNRWPNWRGTNWQVGRIIWQGVKPCIATDAGTNLPLGGNFAPSAASQLSRAESRPLLRQVEPWGKPAGLRGLMACQWARRRDGMAGCGGICGLWLRFGWLTGFCGWRGPGR